MAANRFDQAAQMPVINTYVPIDFDQLYRIGATQKAAVDQAIADIGTAVQTFGEFRSPSRIDTENYYNMTLGQMQDLIDEMSSNPDFIKDAANRSRFYGRLNSLDYAGLSQLKESADNLRAGLKMRAEMEAKGLYNENWDDSNIESYDTLGNRAVFSDITPVAYMNANQLSNPYFDNLSKGTIGTTWKDGVKYTVTGNTVEDLRAVADARYSDIVNTPQGQKYYQQFLRENNGNAEAATRAFKDMIVASQIDRTLRPTLTVDPAWLAQLRASYSRPSGQQQQPSAWPTRLDFIQSSFTRRGSKNVAELSSKEDAAQQDSIARNLWGNYIDSYNKAARSGNPDDLTAASKAQNDYYQYVGEVTRMYNREAVLKGFQEGAGFSATNVNVDSNVYSNDKYLSGIEKGLRNAEQQIAIKEDKDAIVTGLGALPNKVTVKGGGTSQVFEFNNTEGFLLPETVFRQVTSDGKEMPLRGEVTRTAGLFRDNAFPFQELVETGSFSNVQFIPDGGLIQNGVYDYALRGKLRIPRQQVEQVLGTGIWGNAGSENDNLGTSIAAGADYLFTPFGRYSTLSNLQDKYNAKTVTEKVGKDDVEYIEIDAYRQLPSTYYDGEWWQSTLQSWQGSPSTGGIGGSSQAKEAYPSSSIQFLNN